MLSKKESSSIWYLCLAYLVGGVLHVLLRNVDFTDCFAQIYYSCIVLVWSVTISGRIIDSRVRHTLYGITFFMEMYFLLQICKYRLYFNNLYVWSYYYIPMLVVPLLLFYLSLYLNRQEHEKLDWRWNIAAIPAVFLILLIITNGLHFWFFRFEGTGAEAKLTNTGILVYVYWAYVALLIISAIVIMFRKCRISISKKHVGILTITVIMCAVIFLLYVTGLSPKLRGIELWNIGELFAFCTIAIVEVCIMVGLLPANTNYSIFFNRTDIPAVIKDTRDNLIYSTSSSEKLNNPSEDEYIKTASISGGSVSWIVDYSAVTALNRQIEEVTEQVMTRNNYLKTQNSLKEERVAVDARNEVYDRIAGIVSSQIAKIEELLADNETDYTERLKEIAVYNAYIKRRSNMELLSESAEFFTVTEIVTAIGESAEYLKLNGTEVMVSSLAEGRVPADVAILTYEFFEEIAEILMDEKKKMSVILSDKGDLLSLRILVDAVKLPFSDDWKQERLKECGGRINVTENDDDTIIALIFEKGGDSL